MEDNVVITAMKERRSCRKFKADEVPQELIDKVVEAGLWAANGMSAQAANILVVKTPEMREKFRAANAEILGRGADFDPFYGAPVYLAVVANTERPTYLEDGSLVLGNMMLAAHSLGLGSIWIHRCKEEFERPEFQQILTDLGFEGEWAGVGHCAIGYSDNGEGKAKPRKTDRVYEL